MATTTETVERFLRSAGVLKAAADSGALAQNAEGGPTDHPSKKVDNGSMPATTGAQAKANDKALAESVGPARVETNKEGGEATVSSPEDGGVLQIGPKKSPTGKSPSTETPSAGTVTPDPGSDHPARTDNSEVGQPKYAFDEREPLAKLAADLTAFGNELLAACVVEKQAANATAAPGDLAAAAATAAGYELAGIAGIDKQAAVELAKQSAAATIKEAHVDAGRLILFLRGMHDEYAKQAAVAAQPPVKRAGEGDSESTTPGGELSAPPGGGAGEGPGAEPGAGGDAGQLISQLAEMLGTSPDKVIAALSTLQAPGAMGSGEGPGGPPAGPAMPPGAGPGGPGAPGMEVAAAQKEALAAKSARAVIEAMISRTRRQAA